MNFWKFRSIPAYVTMTILQRHRQMDGQTDGQTAVAKYRALCAIRI